jgi:hypothetical protein
MRLLLVLAVAGCATPTAEAAPDPCGAAALKLAGAKLLVEYKKPEFCEAQITSGRAVMKSQVDFDRYFRCAKDHQIAIDWKKQALVFDAWMMSPAAAGLDAYDDGKVITFVTRDRSPCPNDPHAMPITLQKYFVLAAGGAGRTYADASCTMPAHCK